MFYEIFFYKILFEKEREERTFACKAFARKRSQRHVHEKLQVEIRKRTLPQSIMNSAINPNIFQIYVKRFLDLLVRDITCI